MSKNINLHLHTGYSLNDGTITPPELVSWCDRNGADTIVITDHGTLMGVDEFNVYIQKYNKDNNKNLKFIPGTETYVDFGDGLKRHLVLLPIDYQGYKELMKAVTESNSLHGISMTPSLLSSHFGPSSLGHNRVIALSACISGVLGTEILYNSRMEKNARAEERKAQRIEYDRADYEEKSSLLNALTIELDKLSTERRRLGELKEKRYTKRKNALNKLPDNEEKIKLVSELEAEIRETEQAIVDYPGVRKEELALSKQRTAVKDEVSKYDGKIERVNEHLKNADEYRNMKREEEELYCNAVQKAREMIGIFGEGNFYAELQYHGSEDEGICYPMIADIAYELGLPMVATNDAHVAENTESCFRRRQLLRSLKYNKWEERDSLDEQLYLKTDDELKEWLMKILPENVVDEAIKTKNELSSKMNVEFPKEEHYPKFPTEGGETAKERLVRLAREGVDKRYPKRKGWTVKHAERVRYELEVIEKLGVIDYLLIVQDFLEYGRLLGKIDLEDHRYLADPYNIELLKELTNGRVGFGIGAGRGSAVGSLVCYLIGITDVDPMKYGLLFERFLNTERVTMPDIDSDFSPEIRGRVLDYVKYKYGEKAVCCIMTVGTQAAKNAIRNCARLYGDVKYGDGRDKSIRKIANEMCELVPDDDQTINACELAIKKKFEGNEDALKILEDAKLVEGTFTNTGVHAAGVIIADNGDVQEYVPLMLSKEGLWVSQCDMNYVESKGLLKMDFLGLKNLEIITKTLRAVQKNYGISIEMEDIPMDDKAVLNEIFVKGRTDSVFQFESEGMKNMLRKFKPESVEHLILLNALYRPGPLQYADDICAAKNDPTKKPTYICEPIREVLCGTFGYPVYQEEVMQVFNKGAGFSLGESDIIRRYMSKKKTEKFMEYKDKFISGLVEHGAERDKACEFWEQLIDFSKYGFNKSHAAAYAVTAYYTAWLKYYYTKEYLAAVMNLSDFAKMSEIIRDAKTWGITVIQPDINVSECDHFALSKERQIRFGLSGIKQIGSTAKALVEEREENGTYKSFEDFMDRTNCPKDIAENLILAGAFDSLERHEKENIFVTRSRTLEALGLEALTDYASCLVKEKEVLSVFMTGNPVQGYRPIDKISDLTKENKDKKTFKIVGIATNLEKRAIAGGQMISFTLEDAFQSVDAVCWPDTVRKLTSVFEENSILVFEGFPRKKKDSDEIQFVVNDTKEPELNYKSITWFVDSKFIKDKKIDLSAVKKYPANDKTGLSLSICYKGVIKATAWYVSPEILNDPELKDYLSVN